MAGARIAGARMAGARIAGARMAAGARMIFVLLCFILHPRSGGRGEDGWSKDDPGLVHRLQGLVHRLQGFLIAYIISLKDVFRRFKL